MQKVAEQSYSPGSGSCGLPFLLVLSLGPAHCWAAGTVWQHPAVPAQGLHLEKAPLLFVLLGFFLPKNTIEMLHLLNIKH